MLTVATRPPRKTGMGECHRAYRRAQPPRHRQHFDEIGFGEDHGEFLAAVAGEHIVVGAKRLAHAVAIACRQWSPAARPPRSLNGLK
jgi:hypothetical protein